MRFLLRRVGFFIVTLWAAVTLNFILPRIMPGNPAAIIASKLHGVPPTAVKAISVALGLNTHQSLWVQYWDYLKNTAVLNLGQSLEYNAPVKDMIGSAIWWTLGLVGITTVVAFVLGSAVGAISAWRRGSRLDSVLPPLLVFTTAIPYFWVGLMLILIFSSVLGVMPSSGGYPLGATPGFNLPYIGNVLEYSLMPAAALLITSIGGWVLTMRNTMVGTLTEDYVRMARAKGLSSRRIMVDYAARNAILPNLTGFAMSLGFVVSGAILVEYVFNYPGVGFMLYEAVANLDYPLMQGLFLLITLAVLVAIVLSDIATAILDPRTRTAG
ncbi:MAG TPA: ABC transporter permease [Streptosporangiaceae bacterium]|nr:ABC transporter permease [Streptosporangiaceae bacterium]